MKKLNKKSNINLIGIYVGSTLLIVLLIGSIVWIQTRNVVEINLSEDLSTTQIVATKPFPTSVAISLGAISIFIILVGTIVLLNKQKNKLLNEVRSMLYLILKSDIEQISKNFEYHELELIKIAYNEKIAQIADEVKRRDEYFNMTVHDLKVPIQAVKSNLSILEKFPDDQEIVDDLRLEVDHLESEVSRYLLLEKIEYFEKVNIVNVELNSYMQEVIRKYAFDSFDLTVEYCDNSPVKIDKLMFEKIVINLVQNAIQNSPNQALTIKIEQQQITFENISKEPVTKIFYCTRSKHSNGNGFGTQIIAKYIEMQNLWLKEEIKDRNVKIIIGFKGKNEI